jgi:hypothetical protein
MIAATVQDEWSLDWPEWSLGRVVADLLEKFLFLRFLGGLHIDLWFWEVYNLLIQF